MSFDEEQRGVHDECAHEIRRLGMVNECITKERDTLREFVESIMSHECEDAGDIQGDLERLGLIVSVPASKQMRNEYDCETMFVPAWKAEKGEGES